MKTVHHRDNIVKDGEGVSLSKLLFGDHIVLQVDEVSRVGTIVLRRDTVQHQTHTAHEVACRHQAATTTDTAAGAALFPYSIGVVLQRVRN